MKEEDIRIESTPESKSPSLLESVMPLVVSTTATGASRQPFPRNLAFNLFGQGIAFFQGAHTLIDAHLPAEALPLLQGLTTIAARFEQIAQATGAGQGVVVTSCP